MGCFHVQRTKEAIKLKEVSDGHQTGVPEGLKCNAFPKSVSAYEGCLGQSNARALNVGCIAGGYHPKVPGLMCLVNIGVLYTAILLSVSAYQAEPDLRSVVRMEAKVIHKGTSKGVVRSMVRNSAKVIHRNQAEQAVE